MITLEAERCLPLTPRRASRVVCHSGTIWVTREGDLRDFFLGPGDGVDVAPGVTLVSALESATLTLVAPGPWWRACAVIGMPLRWYRRVHA